MVSVLTLKLFSIGKRTSKSLSEICFESYKTNSRPSVPEDSINKPKCFHDNKNSEALSKSHKDLN